MENPISNILAKISTGDDPVKTFKIIDDFAELKTTTIEPAKSIVNPAAISAITFYYHLSVEREIAIHNCHDCSVQERN